MRRLTITGLCALALLSGCASSGGGGGGPTTKIALQCPGKDVNVPAQRVPKGTKDQTIHFDFGGQCKFTDFHWRGYDGDPPGITHQHITFPTPTIEVHYDGTAIPESGYYYKYENDDSKLDGNGGGVIHN